MTLYWRLPVSVTLLSPWAIPGDEPAGTEQDIRLARDARRRFIIPGTHVKGHIRAALTRMVHEALADPGDLAALLGAESPTSGPGLSNANTPARGVLSIGDLTTQQHATGLEAPAIRIEINEDLGTAREGHLLLVECPFPFGTEVEFQGKFLLRGAQDPVKIQKLLQRAAERVLALGGMKSVGYGRIKQGSWKIGDPEPIKAGQVDRPANRLTITWSIDRPFLVNASREAGNLIKGNDVIPGAAIKGALAELAAQANLQPDELAAVRIGHAFPACASATARQEWRKPVPRSLSIASGKLWCHLHSPIRPKEEPHKFEADWKSDERTRVLATLGWPKIDPGTSGRSRTAIDPDTLGARYIDKALAKTLSASGQEGGQLFSEISVRPDEHRWIGEVAGEAAVLQTVLAIAREGIPWFGKTEAVITAEEWSDAASVESPANGKHLDLCLLTEAALLDPVALRKGISPFDVYREHLAEQGLDLERAITREALRGGYLALRYPPESGGYSPWIVTLPGSVFRVRVTDPAKAADVLGWGLPPASCFSSDWTQMPFLRENGFGQVARNLVDHQALARGLELAGAQP